MSLRTRSVWLQSVLNTLEAIAPLRYAEKSWDNVGLLLEAPNEQRPNASRVLLAIDATPSVVQEAIDDPEVGLLVAYHPTIFRGWKRLNLQSNDCLDTINQDSILRLAVAGISLYSPHTALDNIVGGINDWILDGLSSLGLNEESRSPIVPNKDEEKLIGSGRFIEFNSKVEARKIIEVLRNHLGLTYLRVAWANGPEATNQIHRIAVCAGSGGSILEKASITGNVDMVITGELGHHEMLRLRLRSHVILCEHWGSEHGYLKAKLLPTLRKANLKVNLSKLDEQGLELILKQ